ncbi:Osmotically-inducible protein OsmY, contains BON domain [Cupriavidus sp. YR651]|uniref:BON domain-containing protein n=1 Tax=Cupriavidus sp. YR651 TaxID=1855315 RepID=UPI0008898743|nr:Osmotically-inducible protein OsmY, contains BON domain [Cupriavidus sp. YR651]
MTTVITQKTSPARMARTAITVAALVVSATQLAGCFPVLAGAVGTGVVMATDRRPTGTQTIDRGLQLEIDNTLNARYSGQARVDAAVFNRKVLLVGEAKDANVKQQVDQYVRGLSNAREVVNELEITSSPGFMTKSNDAYLTSKVKTLLVTADGVPANSIKVTTDKSVVYLMGVVTSAEGDKATEVARNASGVQKVVKVFDYVSDAERARLDAASSSTNGNTGSEAVGTPAPVQSVPGTAPNAPVTSGAPATTATNGTTTSPVAAPVSSPVALPPGRSLP